MDSQEIYPLLRRNIVPICLGVVGLILLAAGIFQFVSKKQSSKEPAVVFEQNKPTEEAKSEIVIDVEGAVIKPGVYKVASNARMVDALAAAGGLSEDADRDYVQKNINLAGKLTDGLKIYVPRTGEDILSTGAKTGPDESSAVININSASISDLDTLPGVGDVTAQKIIDGRPYGSTDELLSKKIVGSATYEKIKDKIAAN